MTSPPPPTTGPWWRRVTPLNAAVAGFLLGMNDYLLLRLVGVEMRVGSHDVTLLVITLFALNFAAMGYVIGRLLEARDRLHHSAAVIQEQLEALEAGQQRLLQAEKLAAIGQLAAGVAHEVRNPLGIIRASASLLLEDLAPGSDAHRAGEFIREEVDRLNGVVTGLLDFARPISARLTGVDLYETLNAACYRMEETLRSRGIGLELRVPPELPPAHGDPDLCTQILFGLLLNAAQAVDDAGRIAVRVEPTTDALRLEVADDGPGVPAELRERLFQPFFTTRAGGTGLGLATAARIAEANGGLLEFVPDAGEGPARTGACFRLTLQRAPAGVGISP